MDDHPRPRSLTWSGIVGWVLVALALFFVGRWIRHVPASVWQSFRHVQPLWLIVSFFALQFWFLLRFAAWYSLSSSLGSDATRQLSLRRWTVSEFLRYIPGSVVMFAARYRGAVASGATKFGASSAVMTEALGLVSGACVVGSLWLSGAWRWSALALAAIFIGLLPYVHAWLLRRRKEEAAQPVTYGRAAVLVVMYTVVWLSYGFAHAAMFRGIPGLALVPSVHIVGISVAAWLIGYLSIVTPMGLGVREVALVQLFKPWLAESIASAFAAISRVWLIGCELVFVLLVVVFTKSKSSE